MEEIYLAGGCLWGVQHYFKSVPGVIKTEAGRANGRTALLDSPYDGYAECVRVAFDPAVISVSQLMEELFCIIDPYSVNKQGVDVGEKYRTGVYSVDSNHLKVAQEYIDGRDDRALIKVEVKSLTRYIPSAEEHQDRLERFPEDFSYCHIPLEVMNKHRNKKEL